MTDDIELVIKIPQKIYKSLLHKESDESLVAKEMRYSIENGTPLPKGHWIKHERDGIKYLECSECLYWSLEAYLFRNSYCPNCGCRMGGGG